MTNWLDMGGGRWIDTDTQTVRDLNQERHARSTPPPVRTNVTAPYNPNQQIFAGFSNNQFVDGETAKTLLATAAPDLMQNEQSRAQLTAYIDGISASEGVLTAQRVAELALAARTALSGTPDQIAHQRLVERGHAADLAQLPKGLASTLQKQGIDEAEVAQFAKAAYPGLDAKTAIARYYKAAQQTFGESESYEAGAWHRDPRYNEEQPRTPAPAAQQGTPVTMEALAALLKASK